MNPDIEIGLDAIRARLGRPGFALVDVLPHASFVDGHIPGSLSLPIAELRARAPIVLPDTSMEIVVYCGGPT